MNQSLQSSSLNDIRAGQTLTELIDNNQRVLESRIKVETIKNFIEFLKNKDKDVKYIEILRAICICDNEPMIKNQKDITDLMLIDSKTKEELLFVITNDAIESIIIILKIPGYTKTKLEELESISKDQDNGKTYNYVLGLINLLSNLCQNRNYLAIDILQKEFPYEICFKIVSDSKYSYGIREVFTNLLINLWIDVSPYQKINLPFSIKIWQENKDYEIFKALNNDQKSKYGDIKQFISDYLKNMKTNAKIDEGDKYMFDLSILNLTKMMLQLGLIPDIAEINQIIVYLKNYLRSSKQVSAIDALFDVKKSLSIYTSRFQSLGNKVTNNPSFDEIEEIEVPSQIIL